MKNIFGYGNKVFVHCYITTQANACYAQSNCSKVTDEQQAATVFKAAEVFDVPRNS